MKNVVATPWLEGLWEADGKQIQTRGHVYLGVAKDKNLAILFAESGNLYQLCKRSANGENVKKEAEGLMEKIRTLLGQS